MAQGRSIPPIPTLIEGSVDPRALDDPGWSGSFLEFLNIASAWPAVGRTAVQRLFDRVAGREVPPECAPVVESLLPVLRAASDGLLDAGIPIVLAGQAEAVRAAVAWLASELAEVSGTRDGALFSFVWPGADGERIPCPIAEDPLRLVPAACREEVVREILREQVARYPVAIRGEPCAVCAERLSAALYATAGDWSAATRDLRVERLLLDPSGGRGWLRLCEAPSDLECLAAANRGILLLEGGAAGSAIVEPLRAPGSPWDLVAFVAVDGEDSGLDAESAAMIRKAGAWVSLEGPEESPMLR
ncbi:MAG: hypothetical protein JXP34_13920 [Planctomycetes bacterium]|nr:hypothetical protein [Planctomycetota bacterium]